MCSPCGAFASGGVSHSPDHPAELARAGLNRALKRFDLVPFQRGDNTAHHLPVARSVRQPPVAGYANVAATPRLAFAGFSAARGFFLAPLPGAQDCPTRPFDWVPVMVP